MNRTLMFSNSALLRAFTLLFVLPMFSSKALGITTDGNLLIGSTLDGVYYRELKIDTVNQPTEITFPYRDEDDDQFSYGAFAEYDYRVLYGLHTDAYFFSAEASKKFDSRVEIKAHAGVDTTAAVGATTKVGGNGLLSVTGLEFANQFDYNFSIQHGLAYSLLEVEDHFPDLRTTKMSFDLNYIFLQRFKANVYGNWGWLTDGNIEKYGLVDVMCGILIEDPWLWLGFGADDQRFVVPTDNYWSPQHFLGVGPRLEFSATIVGDFLGNLSATEERIHEDGYEWGYGTFFTVGLQWRKRDTTHITLSWTQIRSQRLGDLWTQNDIMLNVVGYF